MIYEIRTPYERAHHTHKNSKKPGETWKTVENQ